MRKAILKYDMIQEGDRILIAVSGGKDSMTMLYNLAKSRPHFPVKYEVGAIHIKTDFCNCSKKSSLEAKLEEWEVPYEIVPVSVTKRLKEGRKMNCYWCSTQRRMELIKYAGANGYNKIALGHHMDDILETFFMNMAYNSELSTMLPVLQYDNYPFTVIRPLALVKEKEIIRFAEEMDIHRLVCKCRYGANSKRKDMRKVIEFMTDGAEYIRENIYNAMENPKARYLLDELNSEAAPEVKEGVGV